MFNNIYIYLSNKKYFIVIFLLFFIINIKNILYYNYIFYIIILKKLSEDQSQIITIWIWLYVCFSVLIRMQTEGLEERTVEVLQLPDGVDEELLCLYFENKRRSGGGPLESVDRKGDSVILVFEDAQGK